jgi:hypothetical protein
VTPASDVAGPTIADTLSAHPPQIVDAETVPEPSAPTGRAEQVVERLIVAAPPAESADSDYALVAPIELHFTSGEARVGVRPGTRTYGEFQRLADILLGDLKKARGW